MSNATIVNPAATEKEFRSQFESHMRESARTLLAFLHAQCHDRSVVEELFQQTMITAWRIFSKYDQSRPFGPWIRGVASKIVLSERSKRPREMFVETLVLEDVASSLQKIELQSNTGMQDTHDALRECIQLLPPIYQEIVRRYYFEDESLNECVDAIGESLESLKKRLQRARAKLSDCLRRKGCLPHE